MTITPFTLYEKSTGRILSFGTCQAQHREDFITDDSMALLDEHPPNKDFYVRNGQLVSMGDRPDLRKWDYELACWVPDIEQAKSTASSRRSQLLADSDWTDTLSAKSRLGDALYDAWQTYRQALRDITDQPTYPLLIVWPTKPS